MVRTIAQGSLSATTGVVRWLPKAPALKRFGGPTQWHPQGTDYAQIVLSTWHEPVKAEGMSGGHHARHVVFSANDRIDRLHGRC